MEATHMTIIKNATGSKQVRISNNDGSFYAMYLVNCNEAEGGQVQLAKSFSTIGGAQRWATKLVA
jgi:hypothetical protein